MAVDVHGQQIYTPHSSASGDRHTTQRTALASQHPHGLGRHPHSQAPRPDRLRRDTLTISHSMRTIHSELLWSE